MKLKKPIIPIKQASNTDVKALIDAGYLYVDNKGIHARDNKETKH